MSRDYAYLLGLYLGDGTLAYNGRSFQLRLTLDMRYPQIVEAAALAVQSVVPHGRVHRRSRRGAWIVESGWKDWPALFRSTVQGRNTRERSLSPVGNAR